ncbi:MAG: hypothetical protein KAR45_06635 [Desulfobacteraceae bacterium]|nr:hypothetical protein [Desulfobacteraceae bacterium]
MKTLKLLLILVCLVMGLSSFVFGKTATGSAVPKKTVTNNKKILKSAKGAKVLPGPFRVKNVTFNMVSVNGKRYLAAAVMFNRNVDASTVNENSNIRMLRKNENHFWVDASTQNNTVRVRPNFITWLCGKQLESGAYVMHLRGTIKSADGIFLDCNGDGVGEGGNLPAYESKLYKSPVLPPRELEEKVDTEMIKELLDKVYDE